MKPKILVFSNQLEESLAIKDALLTKLRECEVEVVDEDIQPDYIISVGGDGTFLSAFHRYKKFLEQARFIGIHTGHLGFYTDWLASEIDDVIAGIENIEDKAVSYPLLEVEVTLNNGAVKTLLALNEFTIRSSTGTMVSDVYVKEYFFETFRGDGICVSTPTGSTGLNKSLGGAVIHPRLDALQLTEMASINNRVYRTLGSSIIIPKDEWFLLKPDEESDSVITIDNLSWHNYKVALIRCRIAEERIKFANFRHTHFWDRVENAFIGRKKNLEYRMD